MRILFLRRTALSAISIFCVAAAGRAATATGFPFAAENLTYSINWPSGLSLGEGHLRASNEGGTWSFDLTLDASVPGFDVNDHYHSSATPDFCSNSFQRTSTHGARKTQEIETIADGQVTRETATGGGKSVFKAPACVKDALTFLFFTRRELSQGRMPPLQQIVFGPLHTARFDYVGAPMIRIAGKPEQSDMLTCTMTGPASSIKFEMYFARDPARTPLLIKVPLQMGTFAMEIVR